jgi:signal transduction histidine kinase
VGQAALIHRRFDSPSGGFASPDRDPLEISLFRGALDALADAVAITAAAAADDEPRIVYENPRFSALKPGGAASTAKSPVGQWPVWTGIKNGHALGGVRDVEIIDHAADGAQRLLRLRTEPLLDRDEHAPQRLAVVSDVTYQRNLEDALRRNERLACIGLLGAGIAHEISNPAGSALLAAETALAIKDDPRSAARLGACLENIVASMDRCGRIVRTLLRYSRQEPIEKQACSINDVVVQAIDQARPYADSQEVELLAKLQTEIPLAPMNPLEIELVLVNLLRNAIEASNHGARVVIGTEHAAGKVRAVVSDEGRGMNEEQLAHVFDPLYTTRHDCGGVGLGMSIAKKIVQCHQGGLSVSSRPGQGTTVAVELPAAAEQERQPTCTKNRSYTSSTTTRKSANRCD